MRKICVQNPLKLCLSPENAWDNLRQTGTLLQNILTFPRVFRAVPAMFTQAYEHKKELNLPLSASAYAHFPQSLLLTITKEK